MDFNHQVSFAAETTQQRFLHIFSLSSFCFVGWTGILPHTAGPLLLLWLAWRTWEDFKGAGSVAHCFRGFCPWLPRVAELRQSITQEGRAAEGHAHLHEQSSGDSWTLFWWSLFWEKLDSMSPVVFTRRKVGLSEKVLGVWGNLGSRKDGWHLILKHLVLYHSGRYMRLKHIWVWGSR